MNKTILSQYANSDILLSLIESMDDALDATPEIDDFFNFCWNILTAKGEGLNILGRIVVVSRVIPIPNLNNFFGFSNAGASTYFGWGQAPFWSGTPDSENYILTDDAYRQLILVKALSNISDASAQSYNRLLSRLFAGRGKAYVQSLGDMEMTLVLNFQPEPFELSILKYSGAFSGPAGVEVNILVVPFQKVFGFATPGLSYAGWSQAPFFHGFA